jgi:fructose-1,6-bisphosphatase/inositol monophosphatase family enzyme
MKGKPVSAVEITNVLAWAREAGALARGYFNNVRAQRKADHSWVTEADLAIEQLLRQRIDAAYPGHGIMGEEQGVGAIDREFVWSLDPIDGTGAFVAGLPTWCVSIGLMRAGQPYLGVIYVPLMDDCYWADAGGPAYRNGTPITVSPAETIDSNDWISVPSYAHRRYRIDFPGKTRNLSSVAIDCCYVARGSSLGALISRAKLWDVAAGLAILRAAGGVVSGLSGAPVETAPLLDGSKLAEPVVLGPPQLLERLRGYISRR